jgi:beta-xylosidase
MPLNEDFKPQNFIITSDDLTRPESFSDPIYFDFHGIDPSLFFDIDGEAYLQGSFIYSYRKNPATVLRQVKIDPKTAEFKSEWRDIWTGSGGKCVEGPHLYFKDGAYWLLAAEGGTHRGHMVTMARSDNVWGPFESCESNPLLTKEHKDAVVQCVGHAELFDDCYGKWWACFLTRREYGSAHPMGRETFMLPVEWKEGEYPSFATPMLEQPVLDRQTIRPKKQTASQCLVPTSPQAVFIRSPNLEDYTTEDRDETIQIQCSPNPIGAESGSPAFIGVRQTALESKFSVVVDLNTLPKASNCGLAVYKDTYRHLCLDMDVDKQVLSLKARLAQPENMSTDTIATGGSISARLSVRCSLQEYTFYVEFCSDNQWSHPKSLGRIACAKLSGDDFTGMISKPS